MNRLLTILSLLIPAVLPIVANGEVTDVTAQYITNSSFEADAISSLPPVNNSADGLRGYTVAAPQGWTVKNGANAVSLIVKETATPITTSALSLPSPMSSRPTICAWAGALASPR